MTMCKHSVHRSPVTFISQNPFVVEEFVVNHNSTISYFPTYRLLTYLFTYLLHSAESFLRT